MNESHTSYRRHVRDLRGVNDTTADEHLSGGKLDHNKPERFKVRSGLICLRGYALSGVLWGEEIKMGNDAKILVSVFSMAGLGVVIAYIVGLLNTEGIVIDEVITSTLTIVDIQTLIILLFILVGLILAAVRK